MFTHIPTLAAVSNRFDTQLQARRNTLVTSRRILKKTANSAIDTREKKKWAIWACHHSGKEILLSDTKDFRKCLSVNKEKML